MLRPILEDERSREVDHKLQQLEKALKAMQGPQSYGSIDLDDLCYSPGIQTNFKFKQSDFDKYDGSGCPYAHLQMYARKMAPYANDERLLQGIACRESPRRVTRPSRNLLNGEDPKQLRSFHLSPTVKSTPSLSSRLPRLCMHVGHSIKHCTALKHNIQDLIDEGKLQLDAKEAESTPNITRNPLPPHDAGTMTIVALDEVEKPMLENASFWSLDELFATLTKYDLIQPIAQMSLNVSPAMIDDALVCPYPSNMKGHTLQDCEDFQRKVKELQVMGSLKFMSAQESEKCIAQFKEVVEDDITDEVYSYDEEDYFGFNNLFGLANMTNLKER
ncbi:hypothetical protein SLEP1_g22822 [Rubroshorea leprosula]|uniref:Uncharacterized protein n=1 Tax=Rubroshorea leprosula TaxID=152421 RepID=A0AAV5JAC8_9ROSI|nr:hypothetical protein SLEP1_g22822 [Rubroshorea leprosula]